ncbi:MAG: hypothetical protein HZA08_06175 [Nitrospirae bacterium]|nr:hypothetical protein [Nitrospirota bacterium]
MIPVEIKLNKTPLMGMGANIAKIREIFSSLDIKKEFIVSLSEQTISLLPNLTAITFYDYILQVTKAASE